MRWSLDPGAPPGLLMVHQGQPERAGPRRPCGGSVLGTATPPLPHPSPLSLALLGGGFWLRVGHPPAHPAPVGLGPPPAWCLRTGVATGLLLSHPVPAGSRASLLATLRTLLAVPWPSQRDVRAWLQLLAVLQWVLSFLLLGEWGRGGRRGGSRAPVHPSPSRRHRQPAAARLPGLHQLLAHLRALPGLGHL